MQIITLGETEVGVGEGAVRVRIMGMQAMEAIERATGRRIDRSRKGVLHTLTAEVDWRMQIRFRRAKRLCGGGHRFSAVVPARGSTLSIVPSLDIPKRQHLKVRGYRCDLSVYETQLRKLALCDGLVLTLCYCSQWNYRNQLSHFMTHPIDLLERMSPS